MRAMDRSYEDIEMKGASASATGVKTDADSFSDSQEVTSNGDNDKRDMFRLGKVQETKRNFGFWSALGFVGELDTFGLSMDAAINDVNSCVHGILGIHPDLTICWIRKRWLWRSLRLLHRHYHLLPLGRAQSCRDGIDGSYFRRSIPLGLRVLASRMAKGPVLLLRLDVHSWMARWYRWKHAGPCLSD